MSNLIKLTQKPVIEHALKQAGEKITKRIADLQLEKQVASEETVKSLKALRAELNKELSDYEDQRKAIKEGIMNPYNDFESIYKDEISTKYKNAVEALKTKIDLVEGQIKERRKKELESYFNAKAKEENLDFIKLDNTGIVVNLSTSEKQYKEEIDSYISKILDDVKMIESSQYPIESMVEYRSTLNASKAVISVKERKEREQSERNKLRQAEVVGAGLVFNKEEGVFHNSLNASICVSVDDIQNMKDPEWKVKMNAIKETTILLNTTAPQTKEKIGLDCGSNNTKPIKEEQAVTRMTFTFEVTGTMQQIQNVVTYLKLSKLEYKEK